jgi:hypothetical protein
MPNHRTRYRLILASTLWVAVAVAGNFALAQQRPVTTATTRVMPRYDANRNLLLPSDYRQWIAIGSSLGLSYNEAVRGHQMFNTTLMEPSAYRHFVETGEFRDGTMFALVLQGVGTNAAPARQGQFASEVHAVEMAVKDTSRVAEAWAYYDFGGPMSGGYRSSAAPQPKNGCYACHVEHAARDNVFMQFYGLLNEAASRAK